MKMKLTFGVLLRKARWFKRCGFDRMSRKSYLAGLVNGAQNWEC